MILTTATDSPGEKGVFPANGALIAAHPHIGERNNTRAGNKEMPPEGSNA